MDQSALHSDLGKLRNFRGVASAAREFDTLNLKMSWQSVMALSCVE